MRKYLISIFILILFISCASSNTTKNTEIDQRTLDEGRLAEIDFEFDGKDILLPVTINGETRTWILDNGASTSVIDSEYANELGLQVVDSSTVYGFVNSLEVAYVEIPEYKIGNLLAANKVSISTDIHDIFYSIKAKHIYGFIGADFLSKYAVKVDLANRKLTFYDSDNFVYEGDGNIFNNHMMFDFHYLPVTIESKYESYFMIDLGANTMIMNLPFAQKFKFDQREGLHWAGMDIGGEIDLLTLQLDKMEVGGFSVPEDVISLPMKTGGSAPFGILGGNIGTGIARHFVIYLDYKNRRVILEKGKDYEKIFAAAISGLHLQIADNNIYIHNILDSTPAQHSGFLTGDIIKSFNGKIVSKPEDMTDIRKALKNGEDQTFKVEVEREGELIELELIPIDIHDLF